MHNINQQSVIVDKNGKPIAITTPTSEVGYRSTEDSALKALYNEMYADPDLVSAIHDVRIMDKRDGRVKKIHNRTTRALTKSGLTIDNPSNNKRIAKLWRSFAHRLGINNREKLASDARGLMIEGNLAMQWVFDQHRRITGGLRMPADTLRANVARNGQFKNPEAAWEQWDALTGDIVAVFSLANMTVGRLTPDNYDDMGSLGRPYLDASREVWKKLIMTEEDLVIRRRERAPMRIAHSLEGARKHELDEYERKVQGDQQLITTNFFSNKKLSVQAIQGDANLDQIADVHYLLDTFFSGSPAPKGLFGYTSELARDILEDLKRDFFDELDALQDVLSWVYEQGFRLQLLLLGINADAYDFSIKFAERLTETLNAKADRALKVMSTGASQATVWETAGLDVEKERARLEDEAKSGDVYPEPNNIGVKPEVKPRVTVTEGNARKGESVTSIKNR